MGHCVPILRAMRITVPLLILPLVLVHSMTAPVPSFTETITLTTGVLPILLAKLLFLKGAVLGNVLAEAPERLLALSKLSRQELQEEPEKGTTDLRPVSAKPQQYKRPRYKPRYKRS